LSDSDIKQYPIDRLVRPVQRFLHQGKSGGLVLLFSVIAALALANSGLSVYYFETLSYKFGFHFNGKNYLNLSLLHWINDALMAIFFFVVGLELKREFVGGELRNPRKAILSIVSAIGGMLVPAVIYLMLNPTGEPHRGWGIPMATDIAFALALLYVLGSKVPLSLKVFLTALAIVDDLGAIVVIALFYSSDISVLHLLTGLSFALLMYASNRAGVRSMIFYALLGIFGVWLPFLLSGVHATIASVIAAFMIPADVRIKELPFVMQMKNNLDEFLKIDPKDDIPNLTEDQLQLMEKIKKDTDNAIPPLQRLEYTLQPFVTFVVLPIFALSNAGVVLNFETDILFSTNVALGVVLGLMLGKIIGVSGTALLMIRLKLAPSLEGMNFKNIIGIGMLAGIGFTMSLFVTSLAFTNEEHIMQAKIGIFVASILSAVIGFFVLNSSARVDKKKNKTVP
jgi:NhaA family Na+:H+ antiporter